MSHPFGLITYACGHSTPVRGYGASVNRPCRTCEREPLHQRVTGLGMLRLGQLLGHPHPSAYCDCDMCQSRIP